MSKFSFYLVSVGALALILSFTARPAFARVGDVTTWLGQLVVGDGGPASAAFLDNPQGFVADTACNLTIADTANQVVRRYEASSGLMSRLAGNGSYLATDGAAENAGFRAPWDVAVSSDGRTYILDAENDRVRRLSSGVVSTWLTGLKQPRGLALVDTTLYVSDTGHSRIVRATVPDGTPIVVTNIATPGKLVYLDGSLYVTFAGGTALAKVDAASGAITTVKDGMTDLEGVAVNGGKVYFVASDRGMFNEVWVYDPATGVATRLVRVVETEWYNHAADILFCGGKMYLLFSSGSSVFRLNLDATGPVRIIGAHRYGDRDGTWREAVLGRPKDFAINRSSKKLYLIENHRVEEFDLTTRVLRFLAGSPMDNFRDGVGNQARFSAPAQMALSKDGTKLYVADKNNNRIRVLTPATQTLTTLTGAGATNVFPGDINGYADGAACPSTLDRGVSGCAYFDRPSGLAISRDGQTLYVADTNNHRIRQVDVATGAVTTLAGSGVAGFRSGIGTAARLRSPGKLLLSADGQALYVVETSNHAVRKIELSTKRVTTLVGTGKVGYREGAFKDVRLSYPDSLELGATSNILYLSEVGSQRIRELNLTTKTSRLLAGSGQRGNTNGRATVARFNNPRGLLRLTSTYLLVADQVNDLIRAIKLR